MPERSGPRTAGIFPLGLGGQAVLDALFLRQPLAERGHIVAGDKHDGMVVSLLEAQVGIPNEARIRRPLTADEAVSAFAALFGFRLVPGFLNEAAKLSPRDFVTAQSKWFVDPQQVKISAV